MNISASYRAALICLILAALALQGMAPGLVWCSDSHGKVTLTYGPTDRCRTESEQPPGCCPEPNPEDLHHCPPCIDIDLSESVTALPHRQVQPDTAASLPAARLLAPAAALPGAGQGFPSRWNRRFPHAQNFAAPHLDITILLI